MSLNGGIFVPTNKDVEEVQIDSGKSFKIGSSLDCEWIIENGGHCEYLICIDNFGRVRKLKLFFIQRTFD